MSWNPFDDPINYFVLAGKKSPGMANVAGLGSPRNWEERQGYGLSGAIVVFTGNKIANFSVEIELATPAEFAAYHEFRRLYAKPPPNVRPKALDFWHPFAAMHEIKSVVVVDEQQPVERDPGIWVVKIDFKQYRKPRLTMAKPDGSKSKPIDGVEQSMQNLSRIVENGGIGNVSDALAPMFAPDALERFAQ